MEVDTDLFVNIVCDVVGGVVGDHLCKRMERKRIHEKMANTSRILSCSHQISIAFMKQFIDRTIAGDLNSASCSGSGARDDRKGGAGLSQT